LESPEGIAKSLSPWKWMIDGINRCLRVTGV